MSCARPIKFSIISVRRGGGRVSNVAITFARRRYYNEYNKQPRNFARFYFRAVFSLLTDVRSRQLFPSLSSFCAYSLDGFHFSLQGEAKKVPESNY